MELPRRRSSTGRLRGDHPRGLASSVAGQLWWRKTVRPAVSTAGNFVLLLESRMVRQLRSGAAGAGGLPDGSGAIDGMSGQVPYVHRRTDQIPPDARYLEVGAFVGSMAAAALAGNDVMAVCIEIGSQFGGPKEPSWPTWSAFDRLRPAVDFRSIEGDFRRTDSTRSDASTSISSMGRMRTGPVRRHHDGDAGAGSSRHFDCRLSDWAASRSRNLPRHQGFRLLHRLLSGNPHRCSRAD